MTFSFVDQSSPNSFRRTWEGLQLINYFSVVSTKICDDAPISPEAMDAHTLNFKPNFKFSQLNFWGEPPSAVPVGECASKPWSIYSARKNLRAQHPLRAEIQSPEKCPLGWVNMHVNNFFLCEPRFTVFSSSNVGGVVVDQLLFRFSICRPISEIFAIKVKSCQKSSRILDVFSPTEILGGRPSKNCTQRYHPWLAARRLERDCEDTPTSLEVIDAHTLNFRPNF